MLLRGTIVEYKTHRLKKKKKQKNHVLNCIFKTQKISEVFYLQLLRWANTA